MQALALVVQRCHEDAVGGAEDHAWQFARLIAAERPVEILTTCAIDADSWQPVLPPGESLRDGITIRRFKNRVGHTKYWHTLHDDLLQKFYRLQGKPDLLVQGSVAGRSDVQGWQMPRVLQEEWMRHQGPDAPGLYDYIRDNSARYAAFLFVTYLFPTTYMGLQAAPREKTILLSTLHDEPPAYLPIFQEQANRVRLRLHSTQAEAELARRLWGTQPNQIVGMAIDTDLHARGLESLSTIAAPDSAGKYKEWSHKEYILYLGRIDAGKGCLQLCQDYEQFCKMTGWQGKLLLAGNLQMQLPRIPGVHYLGFLSDADKHRAIAHARALVMPSPYESLSIVTLEAMLQKTPVLVNGKANALQEHVMRSGCGEMYRDYLEFQSGLQSILQGSQKSKLQAGHDYVQANFSEAVVRERLLHAIDIVCSSVQN